MNRIVSHTRVGTAASEEPMGASVHCEQCGGEGKLYTSRYGGNDPDVWPIGTCPVCEGSGYAPTTKSDAAREFDEAVADRKDPKHPMFRCHNCWKCGSGEKPCTQGDPSQCEYPHAMND